MGGDDFSPVETRLIFKALKFCKSLFIVCANRVDLKDDEIEGLVASLCANNVIHKVELEYNRLTGNCLKLIKEVLQQNQTIRFLSLEGNRLTDGGEEKGMQELCEALKTNSSLLFLNLGGTGLNQTCGLLLLEALKSNKTLIMLHLHESTIEFNTMRQIQDLLQQNLRNFESQRKFEFDERMNMKNEAAELAKVEKVLECRTNRIEELKERAVKRHELTQKLFFENEAENEIFDERLTAQLRKEHENRVVRKKRRPVETDGDK